MAPVVVRTAGAPVAVGTARPASVGTGVVVVVVLDGGAVGSSRGTPDAVWTTVGLGRGAGGRVVFAAGCWIFLQLWKDVAICQRELEQKWEQDCLHDLCLGVNLCLNFRPEFCLLYEEENKIRPEILV